MKKITDAHEQTVTTLNNKIKEAETMKVDETKIASLNKEIEALANIKIDENKIASLKAELEKVYANKNQPAYYTAHYSSKEIAEKVSEAAEILGLTPYLRRKPAALSGGQRQRVALGRAIVRKPKVFLMDEPLSNLDAKLRVQTRGEISKIHQRVGATTIYVTHDQTEAMTMANRIVIMKDGYVQQVGTPKDVYENPTNIFVGGFIGSPSMNFFNGTFDGKNFVFTNGKVKFPLSNNHIKALASYKNKPVVLGIRPEHFFFDDDKMLTSKSVTIP
ncbi:MAG: ATP-binding cassette domain-containing protein, partial [Bacilli bacterium]|nr:ATP-binding cassette domain-containing protein [Bacilli bacterium]